MKRNEIILMLTKANVEIWRDIEGYEGYYQVSNLGRVKSLQRYDSIGRPVKERILIPGLVDGYYQVVLYENGIGENFKVHRLVANAFLENLENKPEVDHINTIRTDNRLTNLKWITTKENMNNPITLENKRQANLGSKNPMWNKPAINRRKVKCVEENKIFDCIKDAQKYYGIKSHTGIIRCCKGRQETTKGYHWEYVD